MAEEIVNRLKAEGQLIRNTGTNSIRAVRIQLDRFENVFETISEQVTLQTQFLSSMAQISEDQLNINKETQEREAERRAREKLSEDNTSSKDDNENDNEKSSKKISLASLAPDSASGFLNTVLKNSMFAGGAFVLSRVFKGFLEERIGETEFSDSLISAISWGAVGTLFGKKIGLLFATGSLLSDALGLPSVVEKIGEAFNLEFTENDTITSGIGTALASGLALAISKKGGLRGKLLVGIATAMVLFGDNAKKWLENLGMPEDWADQTVETTSTIANFATVGMMFGPKGALIAAAIGLAYSLGKGIYDWFINQQDEARRKAFEKIEKMDPLEARDTATGGVTDVQGSGAATGTGLSVAIGNAVARGDVDNVIGSFLENPAAGGPGSNSMLSYMERMADILDNEDSSQEEKAMARENLLLMRKELPEISRQLTNREGDMAGLDLKDFNENIVSFMNDLSEDYSFKRGTKGFQDFGSASFAILHGKEAVVPEETPAGRFLNQFFNKDWTPKMAETSSRSNTLSTVSSGASSNVVINNAPTIAPNVNNVGGSTSVNSTNVVGTGGGSNNIDPYGMPRAAN